MDEVRSVGHQTAPNRRAALRNGVGTLALSAFTQAARAAALPPGQAPPLPAPGALGPVCAVTITAPDLRAAEAAWTGVMGYRVVDRGALSSQVASSWGASDAAGHAFVCLGPQSGEASLLRFVQQDAAPPTSGPTFGWLTTEITVQDVDALYERLKASPFKVTHPPAGVPTYSYLRAMQAEGPAGERLNLTCISPPRPDLAVAQSFVGRCFIVVQGCPDLPATLQFFENEFGATPSAIRRLPSLALAVVPLGDGSKIEADQLGPDAQARPRPPRGLPPGISLVSFLCRSFNHHQAKFLRPPAPAELEPYRGRAAATMIGPSGELIELIEA